jgi:hypothetical protein
MGPLDRHLRSVRRSAGVSLRRVAVEDGVHASTWSRHVERARWARPYEGVAIAPWASDEDRTTVAAVALAHGGAAGGATARWLHGRGPRPRELEVVIPHARAVRRVVAAPPRPARADAEGPEALRAERAAAVAAREADRWLRRCRKVAVHRCRWLTLGDVLDLAGVPTLSPTATALSLAASAPDEVRSYLVDARHAGQLQLDDVQERTDAVPRFRGRHLLLAALVALQDRSPESPFHDQVLTVVQQRGYRPLTTPLHLETPHGRALAPDIPIPDWMVALELDGDRFHRDREARRRDRNRLAAYASVPWVPLVIDHRTWTREQERVFADLDEAILGQRRLGIGVDAPLPPHLAARLHR